MREVVNFKGREKVTAWWSDTVSRVMESDKVLQDLVKTRWGRFPARWVGGEGESVKSCGEEVNEFRVAQLHALLGTLPTQGDARN